MRKLLFKLFRAQNAVVSLEFVMLFIPFMLMLLLILETCRLSYISAVLDYAVSEAGKQAKNSALATTDNTSKYTNIFRNYLTKSAGSLWGFLANSQAVNVSITCSNNINGIITATNCNATASNSPPLVKYRLEYRYHPMLSSWTAPLLNKEVIFAQEY